MIIRAAILAAAVFALLSPVWAQVQFPDTCGTGSSLPFNAPVVSHPIDKVCGLQGKTKAAGSLAQNAVKNNFCSTGTPEIFTPQMLIDLQGKTHVPTGQGKEPPDRSPLQQLGEKKLITLKAYIIEAHHADLGGGESVNCDLPAEGDNDIHIALGSTPNAKECSSASAEISPHYRPASWNEIGHWEIYNATTKKYTPNPAIAQRLSGHVFRITGQLFFDASHAPCPCGTTCNPVRSSDWEIHPVYKIDVCNVGAACNEQHDADWTSFDVWWTSAPPLPPPHSHPPHEPAKKN